MAIMAGKSTGTGSQPIVKLNIGGVCYDTTEGTLSSHGENFFTALLTGHMDTLKDQQGAIFVDRDGNYFGPILHFLRTGRVDIPSSLSHSGVRTEAEFYCVEAFVEALKREEECREAAEKATDKETEGIRKISSGVYVCKEFGWGFMFEEDEGNLLAVRSEYLGREKECQVAFIKAHAEVARVFNRKTLGTSWAQSDRLMLAAFYENCIFRGKYEIDGQTVILHMPVSKHGISTECVAVLSGDGMTLCVDGGKLLSMNALFTKKTPHDAEVIGILNSFVPFLYHKFDA